MREVGYARFVRGSLTSAERAELRRVDDLAAALHEHLGRMAQAIAGVRVHRAQSSAVQAIVAELLRERLGFREEVVLTPELGLVTSARPDFFFALSPGRGVWPRWSAAAPR